MRLIDLDPKWIGNGGEGVTNSLTGEPVPRREKVAIGFRCPCGCDSRTCIPFSNPIDGGPSLWLTAWHREGDTFETLTLTSSILRTGGCVNKWHGFITNGDVTTC
jgi:hypothetical protein